MRNTLVMAALLGAAHITVVLAVSIALVLQTQITAVSDVTGEQEAHQPKQSFIESLR